MGERGGGSGAAVVGNVRASVVFREFFSPWEEGTGSGRGGVWKWKTRYCCLAV